MVGEFELIRRFFERPHKPIPSDESGDAPPVVQLGVGDDCALLTAPGCLAISTDMLVAGRHFFSDVDPESLGHKALAVNLSDLAAMGARPLAFTLALALPEADEKWLSSFAGGMFALADQFDCALIGGDTTRGPLNICVTVFGELPQGQALRRDAAQLGDDLWVSGTLGGAALAVQRRMAGREFEPASAARQKLERPTPRVGLGRRLLGNANACIDLSDGLYGDAAHIAHRSGVGIEIDLAAIPIDPALAGIPPLDKLRLALAGGDDYELAFTAPALRRGAIVTIARELGVRVTSIGRVVGRPGVRLNGTNAAVLGRDLKAYDHFGTASAKEE